MSTEPKFLNKNVNQPPAKKKKLQLVKQDNWHQATPRVNQADFFSLKVLSPTPPKFNIAPEKWWLEDEFPFGIAYF